MSVVHVTLGMLAIVAIPAAITLHTLRESAARNDIPANASRYGYTVSLLLFIVPSAAIAFWFLPQEGLKISKKAFWWTIGLLFPLGAGLDFFFARYFFRFPNAAATLGIAGPALGGPVPIEEYLFYLTGFITVVLLYIWFDQYWLAAYSVPPETRVSFDRLLRFHPWSLGLAAVLIVAAILFKRYVAGPPGEFPGYFVFLVVVALLPSAALFPTACPVINWRAVSLTMFMMLLTSLLWEVTLALPYGWWNFRDEQMVGIRIVAWDYLPIEEVVLWITVTNTSVIVYEIVRRWKASDTSMKRAFLGI
jgi:lycopene cyclase domain-containing protein